MSSFTRPSMRVIVGCAIALLVSSADTYVVILLLPSMMTSFGTPITALQQATPLISGFLIGYVAALPLVGRLSDRLGRQTTLIAALSVFLFGSCITALSTTLDVGTIGRFVQGAGGGGILPIAFAFAADRWDKDHRSIPFGAIGAVQELGSLIGPLYGALILQLSSWNTVFWINIPLSLAIMLCVASDRTARENTPSPHRWKNRVVIGLVAIGGAFLVFGITQPALFTTSTTLSGLVNAGFWNLDYFEIIGAGIWLGTFVWVLCSVPNNRFTLVRLAFASYDAMGIALLVVLLATIVIPFAGAVTAQSLFPSGMWIWVSVWIICIAALISVERNHQHPIISRGLRNSRSAIGGLVTTLLAGAALIAVLIDVPVYVRTVINSSTQLTAAIILVAFLVGVPIGAAIGGWSASRIGCRMTAIIALLLALSQLLLMSQWTTTALTTSVLGIGGIHPSDITLIICGIGFGGIISPCATAVINAVQSDEHGSAAALLVAARTVGMIVGLSLLTNIGIHALDAAVNHIPSPSLLCPTSPGNCSGYNARIGMALTTELHTIFGSAAAACVLAICSSITLPGRKRQPLLDDVS